MSKEFQNLDDFSLEAVISAFNELFYPSHNTKLMGGAEEPLYEPAKMSGEPHRIWFSHDYLASALHEVAHWCLAGLQRRSREDYGYWYNPDGRSPEQQARFERFEVKPQALERIFAYAAAQQFRVSADNLAAAAGVSDSFKQAIHDQTLQYCQQGMPPRALQFVRKLAQVFIQSNPCDPAHYRREQLD